LSGSFITRDTILSRVEAKLSNGNTPNHDTFTFKLRPANSEEWWYEASYSLNNIYSGWFFPIGFPLLSVPSDTPIIWEISLPPQNTLQLGVQEVLPFHSESKFERLVSTAGDVKTGIGNQQVFFFVYYSVISGLGSLLILGFFLRNQKK
jgi:hypothetical protein